MFVVFLFHLSLLTLQAQRVAGDSDVQVFGLQPRQFSLDSPAVLRFGHVQVGRPPRSGQVQARHLTEKPLEDPVHLSPEGSEIAKWCPLDKRHGRSSFLARSRTVVGVLQTTPTPSCQAASHSGPSSSRPCSRNSRYS